VLIIGGEELVLPQLYNFVPGGTAAHPAAQAALVTDKDLLAFMLLGTKEQMPEA
jgi:hypothetical protein